MNKSIGRLKSISSNFLEVTVYYSNFNILWKDLLDFLPKLSFYPTLDTEKIHKKALRKGQKFDESSRQETSTVRPVFYLKKW